MSTRTTWLPETTAASEWPGDSRSITQPCFSTAAWIALRAWSWEMFSETGIGGGSRISCAARAAKAAGDDSVSVNSKHDSARLMIRPPERNSRQKSLRQLDHFSLQRDAADDVACAALVLGLADEVVLAIDVADADHRVAALLLRALLQRDDGGHEGDLARLLVRLVEEVGLAVGGEHAVALFRIGIRLLAEEQLHLRADLELQIVVGVDVLDREEQALVAARARRDRHRGEHETDEKPLQGSFTTSPRSATPLTNAPEPHSYSVSLTKSSFL